jgi:hypothetical protein
MAMSFPSDLDLYVGPIVGLRKAQAHHPARAM